MSEKQNDIIHTSSVVDMLGDIEPEDVRNFEAGKVELSVPRKYVPVKKKVKKAEVVRKTLLPKGKAVPVFSSDVYVDDEGIERMIPPRYDKSKMNLPKAKFKRPENMPMVRDDEVVAAALRQEEEKEFENETPDFIKSWNTSSHDVDAEVNDILDNERVVESVEEDSELSFDDDTSFQNDVNLEKAENVSMKQEQPVSLEVLSENSNSSQNNADNDLTLEEDEEFDIEKLDQLIAESSPKEETEQVLDLDNDDLLSVGEERKNVRETAIPKFELDDVSAEEEISRPILEDDSEIDVLIENSAEEISVGSNAETSLKPEELSEDADETFVLETNSDDSLPRLSESAESEVEDVSLSSSDENQDFFDLEQESVSDIHDEILCGVKFYSGNVDDSYCVISAQNFPNEFIGNSEQNSLLINLGETDYGWGVAFANGLFMGISDVRQFQLKNGRLPDSSGTLFYGQKKMLFSGVERIVLYQIPQYYSYV